MRRSIIAAVCFVLTAIFAASAFGQTPATSSGRIGLVNTALFLEDKPGTGITKFKNAVTSLNNEFKTVNDTLKTLATSYQTKRDAFEKVRASTAPVAPAELQRMATEIQDLETKIKRDQEDAKAKYERRYSQVVGPVYNDIIRAMNEYARTKGYAVILDGARLEEAQILLGFDDKFDVTRDFITFYNARPAAAATTATTTTTTPPRP